MPSRTRSLKPRDRSKPLQSPADGRQAIKGVCSSLMAVPSKFSDPCCNKGTLPTQSRLTETELQTPGGQEEPVLSGIANRYPFGIMKYDFIPLRGRDQQPATLPMWWCRPLPWRRRCNSCCFRMNLAAARICAAWQPAPAAADLDQECPHPPLRLSARRPASTARTYRGRIHRSACGIFPPLPHLQPEWRPRFASFRSVSQQECRLEDASSQKRRRFWAASS